MNQPCTRCGRPNPGTQTCCTACGARIKSSNRLWKIAIAALVLIAGLSWAAFLFSNSISQPEQSNKSQPQSLLSSNTNTTPLVGTTRATPSPTAEVKPKPSASPTPAPHPSPVEPSNSNSQNYGNTNTYRNSDGDLIPRPTKSVTQPVGATARCRDGSYSFSRHHQGTCSHRGGVAEWLD